MSPGNLIAAEEGSAARVMKRSAWGIALRGLLAIVLGIVALTRPAMTLSAFVSMLAIYLMGDGLVTLFSTYHAASRGRAWWPYLLEGLLSLGVGLFGLLRPSGLAMLVLVLVAVRAIIVGVVEIGTGISVRRAAGTSGWLLGFGGVASVAFGLLILGRPSVGLLALVWAFSIYAIAFGVLLDGAALTARNEAGRLERRTA
jgi:uncharacterized membrane protein HdeD (DUF308 family)